MDTINLPLFEPSLEHSFSGVVKSLRFCKALKFKEITLSSISKVLYAIQGCTGTSHWTTLRAIPSAGATYPLKIYVSLYSRDTGSGFYEYKSSRGKLVFIKPGKEKQTKMFIHAIFSRTTRYYGSRGERYVLMEVGHALQNSLLESSVLNIDMSYELNIEEINRELKEGGKPLAVIELGECIEKPAFEHRNRKYEGISIGLRHVKLPELSLEKAILKRRSVRKYSSRKLSLEELTYVIYYSFGRVWNDHRPYAPPLNVYYLNMFLVAGEVDGLDSGIYFYNDEKNELVLLKKGDFRKKLYDAALRQEWILKAPVNILLAGGGVDKQYLDVETGMIGQNIYLAATSIGLGTVAIGAFYDEEVADVIGVDEQPLYIMPIGRL